jgi:hypothetical protein
MARNSTVEEDGRDVVKGRSNRREQCAKEVVRVREGMKPRDEVSLEDMYNYDYGDHTHKRTHVKQTKMDYRAGVDDVINGRHQTKDRGRVAAAAAAADKGTYVPKKSEEQGLCSHLFV